MNVILSIIIVIFIVVTLFLVHKLYTLRRNITQIPLSTVVIGSRINFTKDDEQNLQGAKLALTLTVKLIDQEVSIVASELASIATKGDKIHEFQGKIEALVQLRGRLQALYNKQTDK